MLNLQQTNQGRIQSLLRRWLITSFQFLLFIFQFLSLFSSLSSLKRWLITFFSISSLYASILIRWRKINDHPMMSRLQPQNLTKRLKIWKSMLLSWNRKLTIWRRALGFSSDLRGSLSALSSWTEANPPWRRSIQAWRTNMQMQRSGNMIRKIGRARMNAKNLFRGTSIDITFLILKSIHRKCLPNGRREPHCTNIIDF